MSRGRVLQSSPRCTIMLCVLASPSMARNIAMSKHVVAPCAISAVTNHAGAPAMPPGCSGVQPPGGGGLGGGCVGGGAPGGPGGAVGGSGGAGLVASRQYWPGSVIVRAIARSVPALASSRISSGTGAPSGSRSTSCVSVVNPLPLIVSRFDAQSYVMSVMTSGQAVVVGCAAINNGHEFDTPAPGGSVPEGLSIGMPLMVWTIARSAIRTFLNAHDPAPPPTPPCIQTQRC